jgi:predicted Zn finger-like uncharacterized protein
MAAVPTELPPQFGRYRILKKLGAGGMGTVYLAEDGQLGRQVALKVPRLNSPDDIQRFHREARVAAAVNHPNVCPVLDIAEHDGIHFLTMPYLEGVLLSSLVEAQQALPPTRAIQLVHKIGLALQALHERGIVHRDLKPANIMLKGGHEPVIIDFGLARTFSGETQRLTQSGTAVGTPAYMAPEQLGGDLASIGPATDVYSLGVILYELLAGRLPFQADNLHAVYVQIFFNLPPPLVGVDPALEAICRKALAKAAKDRYANMAEFTTALEEYLRQTTLGSTSSTPSISFSRPEVPVPDRIRIHCPVCAVRLRVRSEQLGKRLRCPACKHTFLATASAVPQAVTPPPGGGEKGSNPLPKGSDPSSPPQPAVTLPSREGTLPGNLTTITPAANVTPPVVVAARPAALPPCPEYVNSVGMRFKLLPPGRFLMGSPPDEEGRNADEMPHEVHLSHAFGIGVYPVTQAQYAQVMGRNPSWFTAWGGGKDLVADADTGHLPVESISWDEAMEFCRRLSALAEEKRSGCRYRLPTEAEWEYACREGGRARAAFHCGSALSAAQANFDGRYPYGGAARGQAVGRPTPVGSYPPNGVGLYDLHGNIWEWCLDWYSPDYFTSGPALDPPGPAASPEGTRVLRGGSWGDAGVLCRTACRAHEKPSGQTIYIGFRVVLVAADEA